MPVIHSKRSEERPVSKGTGGCLPAIIVVSVTAVLGALLVSLIFHGWEYAPLGAVVGFLAGLLLAILLAHLRAKGATLPTLSSSVAQSGAGSQPTALGSGNQVQMEVGFKCAKCSRLLQRMLHVDKQISMGEIKGGMQCPYCAARLEYAVTVPTARVAEHGRLRKMELTQYALYLIVAVQTFTLVGKSQHGLSIATIADVMHIGSLAVFMVLIVVLQRRIARLKSAAVADMRVTVREIEVDSATSI